jgi:DNA or RNA helicases of superfamily II
MSLELRDYQKDSINAFWDYVAKGGRSGIICAPTGSGKSLLVADICKTMIEAWKHTHIVIVTHRAEIIEQNKAEFESYYPEAKSAIYSASLNKKETDERVIFAGIQSIYKNVDKLPKIDLVIIDESHLVSQNEDSMYFRFISEIKHINKNVVILGLSATPYRLDSGILYEGENRLFESLIYDIGLRRLIDEGYLSPVISKSGLKKIDLTGVKTVAGEFNKKDLELAADKDDLIKSAVDEIIEYGTDRKSWLVFAAGKDHAVHVCNEIKSRGITCAVVTDDTNIDERKRIIDDHKKQKIRALINVEIFTVGFNNPSVDLLVLMFATKSAAKFVQVCGRGTRTYPGKENCLILDYGQNFNRFGVLDEVSPSRGTKGDGVAPVKECPECRALVHAAVRVCPECEYQFPEPKPSHTGDSYSGAVLSGQDEPEWVEVVDSVEFLRWEGKEGKPDTVRCNFYTAKRRDPYSMWLAPEHGGFPKQKAMEFIRACGGKAETVEHILKESFYYQDPKAILVAKDPKNKRYWRILAFDFPDEKPSRQVEL